VAESKYIALGCNDAFESVIIACHDEDMAFQTVMMIG
jgi:hypothetical protein